jgi:hypothetical protein
LRAKFRNQLNFSKSRNSCEIFDALSLAGDATLIRCVSEKPRSPPAATVTRLVDSSFRAVIRVYDDAGNVIETHELNVDFKEP